MTTLMTTTPGEPTDDLPLALRAHIIQVPDTEEEAERMKKAGRRRPTWEGWPSTVLALDCETTTDATQRLLFGSYRFAKWLPNGKLYVLQEGLVFADDLES